mgnify:FL=1
MTSSAQSYPPANIPASGNHHPNDLSPPKEEQSFNYRAILAVASRRAWLILIAMIAVTGVIWTRTLNQPPRYRSGFQLLVEPIAGDQDFQQELGQLSQARGRRTGLDYGTQIQVLKSSQVMRPIYEQLKADYPGLGYGQLLGNLTVRRLGETKILVITYESGDPQIAGAVTRKVAEEYIDYSEQQQQTAERRVLELIEDQLPSLRDRVESIQDEIQQFRQENNVIDPIAKGNQLSGNISSLEQRQRDTEISIEENRSLRETLLQQLGLNLDEAMTTVALSQAPRYQQLLNRLKDIETEIAVELGRFKEDSPNIEVLKQQRESILNLLQEESFAVLGEQAVNQELRSEINSPNPIRLSLTQELIAATNQIQVLEVRQGALKDAEKQIRQDLEDLTELTRTYEAMIQRLQVGQENLRRFINRREQLTIEAVQSTMPWQILEPPYQPTQPLSGTNMRGLLMGVLAGALAGAAVAYLAEKIDNKFHSPNDVKEASRVPLLGVIPFSETLEDARGRGYVGTIPVGAELDSEASEEEGASNGNRKTAKESSVVEELSFAFKESFRSLHANLSFMNPDDRAMKSLVVSSSVPGEGKSTISLNLAYAAASVGKKVLLVDADMRRPQIHQILELPNQYGLSNVISTGLKTEEAIQRLPANPNFNILTPGLTPPDPNRKKKKKKMAQLMEQWQSEFDLVIYDSPPLGGLADAKMLAKQKSSALLMVAGLGVVDRNLFKDVMETLRIAKTMVLGVVANGRKSGSMGEYSYYYYDNYYYKYSRAASSQSSLASSQETSNASANE